MTTPKDADRDFGSSDCSSAMWWTCAACGVRNPFFVDPCKCVVEMFKRPIPERVKKISNEYVEVDIAMRRLNASLRKSDIGVNRRSAHQTIIEWMIVMTRFLQEQFESDNEYDGCCSDSHNKVRTFDAKEFVVVFCEKHSRRVSFTSGFVSSELASQYAEGIKEDGGTVFRVLPAGAIVAALSKTKVLPQPWESLQ